MAGCKGYTQHLPGLYATFFSQVIPSTFTFNTFHSVVYTSWCLSHCQVGKILDYEIKICFLGSKIFFFLTLLFRSLMSIPFRIANSGHMMPPSQIFFISGVLHLGIQCFQLFCSFCTAFFKKSFFLFHCLYLIHCQVLYLCLWNIFSSYLFLPKSAATIPVETTIFFLIWFPTSFCLISHCPLSGCSILASHHSLYSLRETAHVMLLKTFSNPSSWNSDHILKGPSFFDLKTLFHRYCLGLVFSHLS